MNNLKDQLGQFYDRVQLEDGMFDKMYFAFEQEYRMLNETELYPPSWKFDNWLAANVGIVNGTTYPIWSDFYVVDRNLFMMAVMRYS